MDKLRKEDFRILLVDDKVAEIMILEDVVDNLGFPYTVTKSATEALKHIETNKTHLVISDFNMKSNKDCMNGDDLVEKLEKNKYDGSIIFYTKEHRKVLGDYTDLVKKGIHVIFKNHAEKTVLEDAISNAFANWIHSKTNNYRYYA